VALQRSRVYRNIERRQTLLLGLEPPDWFLLLFEVPLLRLLARGAVGWQILVVVVTLAALRFLKRGRPEFYTTALVLFYLKRRPFFSALARDVQSDDASGPQTSPWWRRRSNNQGDAG
jgi:hypothetical protein